MIEKRGFRQLQIFTKRVIRTLILGVVLFFPLAFSLVPSAFGSAWSGVDETVVEKIANDHGRDAKDPLINSDKGDLLLFLFLGAGAIAGFAAGYYWRILLESREKQDRREP